MDMPDSNAAALTSRIREEALQLGFFKVGIAPVRPLPNGGHFRDWLRQGLHGSMDYMERQVPKRLNPARILPDVRSIVVLAMNYYTGCALTDSPLNGRISRYARGGDYHAAVGARLERLLDFIGQQQPSTEGLCYVDTGPVMEKAWGAQTSLGWIGKNTNLITRERGSWFFIGILLLNLELAYDPVSENFCGRCVRCMKACPTGALISPYVLDARLCISYLSIELRGLIPRRLRPLMGNRVFGCDDCQEVCPWNRFAARTTEKEFTPGERNAMPDLLPLIRITPGEFKERFGDSPIRRATRDGLVRNVAVALGNSGRNEAVPALEEALRDTSPVVRAHAAWALGQIGSEQAFRSLDSARIKESNSSVLDELDFALRMRSLRTQAKPGDKG
jgi:epoxyqueuosine reductase